MREQELEKSRQSRLTKDELAREQPYAVIDGVRIWLGPIPVALGTLVLDSDHIAGYVTKARGPLAGDTTSSTAERFTRRKRGAR